MKLIKASLLILLTIIVLQGKNLFAGDGTLTAGASDLNYQLVNEIKDVLKTPLLVYSGRDLNGVVTITAIVEKNGKITFTDVTSDNDQLNKNTLAKLNKQNLWTNKNLAGKIFKYEVVYSQ
ncbi:MAG: hypothetical protein KDC73_09785 [Ignavibacteriae bacterium]|nr:hypothetical protein [Ignavibacteriota bacterium]MCB9242689.1 hypothetical protein [Ignavibacteriales bacterium]